MTNEMAQFKAIAKEHMQRDVKAGGHWNCTCEACSGIRSLMGADKMLEMRPLIREICQHEERIEQMPDGPERQRLSEECRKLYDKLADVTAK